MELRAFVTKAILDIVEGVEEANFLAYRGIQLIELGDAQKIVFDIAISVEDVSPMKGKGSMKGDIFVLAAGTEGIVSADTPNSRVTRIRFGVRVDRQTPEEAQRKAEMLKALRAHPRPHR
jgi:hypothetical protein